MCAVVRDIQLIGGGGRACVIGYLGVASSIPPPTCPALSVVGEGEVTIITLTKGMYENSQWLYMSSPKGEKCKVEMNKTWVHFNFGVFRLPDT